MTIENVYQKVKSHLPRLLKPTDEYQISLNVREDSFMLTEKITAILNANDRLELTEKQSVITGKTIYQLNLYLHFTAHNRKKIEPRLIAWDSGVKIELFYHEGELEDHYMAKITILSDPTGKRGYLNRFKAFFEMFDLILSFIRQEVDRIDKEEV